MNTEKGWDGVFGDPVEDISFGAKLERVKPEDKSYLNVLWISTLTGRIDTAENWRDEHRLLRKTGGSTSDLWNAHLKPYKPKTTTKKRFVECIWEPL